MNCITFRNRPALAVIAIMCAFTGVNANTQPAVESWAVTKVVTGQPEKYLPKIAEVRERLAQLDKGSDDYQSTLSFLSGQLIGFQDLANGYTEKRIVSLTWDNPMRWKLEITYAHLSDNATISATAFGNGLFLIEDQGARRYTLSDKAIPYLIEEAGAFRKAYGALYDINPTINEESEASGLKAATFKDSGIGNALKIWRNPETKEISNVVALSEKGKDKEVVFQPDGARIVKYMYKGGGVLYTEEWSRRANALTTPEGGAKWDGIKLKEGYQVDIQTAEIDERGLSIDVLKLNYLNPQIKNNEQ